MDSPPKMTHNIVANDKDKNEDDGVHHSNNIDEELLQTLKTGCEMLKFKRNGKKYKRNFYLDPDHQTLKYTGSRKLCRSQKTVEIPDIKEIRLGANTQTFRNVADKIMEGKAFSLIIGPKHESLDLVAKNPEQKDRWVSALRHLMALHKNMEQQKHHEKWAIDHFNMADINKDGGLSFDETLTLLNQMNINMDKRYARKLFDASDINTKKNKLNEDVLDQQEFLNFYKLLIRRPEIVDIIRKHSKNGNTFLEPEELLEFIKSEQKQEDVSLDDCIKLINTYEKTNNDGTMAVEGMRCMLVSRDQAIFNKNHLSIHQNMDMPLSLYFINSSHNTYLTTDQLVGPCSIEGYILALKKGCRCVEVDAWDGADGEPIVYHGHTLTSKIKFVDVIKAISLTAFEASAYPVIISIENHCSVNQQKVMAHHLQTILTDKIYCKDLKQGQPLPSPNDLMGKFVIKGKKLDIPDVTEEVVSEEDEAAEIDSDIVKQNLARNPEIKKIVLAKELSDLIFLRSTHFQGVGQRGSSNTICSFSESKAIAMISEGKDMFGEYNSTNLSRVYPNGIRTDSSNYDPLATWKAGCQISALNFQSTDKNLQLNDAFFRNNGGIGYVLKPGFLCYDSRVAFEPAENRRKIIKIKVISAQQLPKPKRTQGEGDVIDPYVRVKILGPDNNQEAKTRVIENNGFNPVWNETFEFMVDEPELTMVRFVVKDFDSSFKNDFIGQYTLPFNSILEGYHHAHLQDKSSLPITPATLFLHCQIIGSDDLILNESQLSSTGQTLCSEELPGQQTASTVPTLKQREPYDQDIVALEASPKRFHVNGYLATPNEIPLTTKPNLTTISPQITRKRSFDEGTPVSETPRRDGLENGSAGPFGPKATLPKNILDEDVKQQFSSVPDLVETCLDGLEESDQPNKEKTCALNGNGIKAKSVYGLDDDVTPSDDKLCCNLFPSTISTNYYMNHVSPHLKPRSRRKRSAKVTSSWKQDLCFEI